MTTPDRPAASAKRPDPATAEREDLLHYYATDPASGLSGREAERRRVRSDARPLFTTTAGTFPQCLLAVMKDPILWILLAVSLIALFFDRMSFSLGLACLILTSLHILICALLRRRAERVDAAMQRAYDAPLPRVLRSGRVCRVGADRVVPGDILLLHRGDLVPADCRLLRTDRFVVSERELDAQDPDRPQVSLQKDADYRSDDPRPARLSPPHMAYAGGVVEQGSAVALVVAVGDRTHLGGLVGEIRPSHGVRPSAVKQITSRTSSFVSLIMVILIIPLIALGIITLRANYDLLDISLSIFALAALGLCEHTVARYVYIAAIARRDAATAHDAENSADICSDLDAEKLSSVTDILLLGTAGLHDGRPHPAELILSGNRYRCDMPDSDEEAALAVEWLFVFGHGRRTLPATAPADRTVDAAVEELVSPLCDWAAVDTDALPVKYKDIHLEKGGVSAVIDTPEGNRRLLITADLISPAEEDLPNDLDSRLREAVREAYANGRGMLLVRVSDGRGSGQYALFTYAYGVCPKTSGWIRGMESAGIRVTALLSDVSEENTRVLRAAGLTETSADRAEHRSIPDLIANGRRAFEGCSADEITDCIRNLQASGAKVAVLSVDARDVSHLHLADVAITCSPSAYLQAEADFPRPVEENARSISDGSPNSSRADDLCRRRADMVVRRTRTTGGGIGGIRTALLAADRMRTILSAANVYICLSNALRLLAVLLSHTFGLLPIPAPLLIFSGNTVDAAVLFSLSRIPPDTKIARRPVSMTDGMERPWLSLRPELIALAVTGAMPWIIAWVARLAGAGIEKEGLVGFALLSLVAMQTALYITLRPRRDDAGRGRVDRTYALTLLLLVLVYVGTLAVALVRGLHPLYALLIPPLPAVLYAVVATLLRKGKAE